MDVHVHILYLDGFSGLSCLFCQGPIVWNLLEPSTVSARDYAKRAKKSHSLRNINFNEESMQMGHSQIDSDFVFYGFYPYLLLYIFYLYSYLHCTYITFYLY